MQFSQLLILTRPGLSDSAILSACLGGAKWLCVRDKTAPPREILEIFARTQRIAEKFGAQTFLNGRADLARAAHADGLHLPEIEIPVSAARLTLGFHIPCGVSVHSLESARRAAGEGANYLLFGPVFPTISHPETAPTGLAALESVASQAAIPVFAVGGIDASNAARCLEAGAAGVAVISSVWDAPDITQAVRGLRQALGERDESHHGEGIPTDAVAKTGLAALMGQPKPMSDIILGNGKSEP